MRDTNVTIFVIALTALVSGCYIENPSHNKDAGENDTDQAAAADVDTDY